MQYSIKVPSIISK